MVNYNLYFIQFDSNEFLREIFTIEFINSIGIEQCKLELQTPLLAKL